MSLYHTIEAATGIPWLFTSTFVVAAILLLTGLAVRSRLAATNGGVLPDEGVSIRNVVEVIVEFLSGLAEQNMGPDWRKWFPVVATMFCFILIANLIGLIPGISGATGDINTTAGWALIAFGLSEYIGIRTHGWSYVNHFLGPSLVDVEIGGKTWHLRLLAPIFIPLELIGHFARIVSLSIRLLANMFADHTVVGVWILLAPAILPAVFMGLGVLVACLQAYVFALLTMIYIGLALEEAH